MTYTYGQAALKHQAGTKPMAHHEPIRISSKSDIPDKLYFRIGDVAKLCEVPAYVLRFWESEFPQLKPNKGGTSQRLYRRKDVEMALRIKHLLYDEGYTIPGARQIFKHEQRTVDGARGPQLALAIEPSEALLKRDARKLQALRRELLDLHASLSGPVAGKGLMVRTIRENDASREAKGPTLTSTMPLSGMDDLFKP